MKEERPFTIYHVIDGKTVYFYTVWATSPRQACIPMGSPRRCHDPKRGTWFQVVPHDYETIIYTYRVYDRID